MPSTVPVPSDDVIQQRSLAEELEENQRLHAEYARLLAENALLQAELARVEHVLLQAQPAHPP
jgi:hypothetical protein